jgi:uncharacterized protein YwqG
MEIKEAILNSSLAHRDELCKLVRQSYWLRRDPKDPTSQDPFVSHFGGKPDLPIEVPWPLWNGKPLSFVAQINLTELPEIPDRILLPRKGMLYYFYDAEREAIGWRRDEKDSFAVLYADPDTSQAIKRELPEQLTADEIHVPARVTYEIVESEPGWEHPYIGAILESFKETLDYGRVVGVGNNLHEGHRILGYPMPVQVPVGMDCEAVRLGYYKKDSKPIGSYRDITGKGAGDWELLLQVKSDDELNMYWPPDCGVLYYMIRHDDLVEGRFDRSWMIKQFS